MLLEASGKAFHYFVSFVFSLQFALVAFAFFIPLLTDHIFLLHHSVTRIDTDFSGNIATFALVWYLDTITPAHARLCEYGKGAKTIQP